MEENPPRRFLGVTWGTWGPASGSTSGKDEFEALTRQAEDMGVRWQDLVGDGYRTAGDLVAGGLLIRYDWPWRVAELQRRIDMARGEDVSR